MVRLSFHGQNRKKPYFGLFLGHFLMFFGHLSREILSKTLVKLVVGQFDTAAQVDGVIFYF